MDNNYKKATHIVVLVELIIDYALMFGSLLAAVLIFFNMGTLVNATVDGAMNSAYTSASASGSSGGELGQAVGAVAVGVFSSFTNPKGRIVKRVASPATAPASTTTGSQNLNLSLRQAIPHAH